MRLLPEPVPTIILPKYSTEDVFGLFLRFLEAQGFTLTATLCIKELAYRKLKSTDANRISKAELEQHLAFCMTQLAGQLPEEGRRAAPERSRGEAFLALPAPGLSAQQVPSYPPIAPAPTMLRNGADGSERARPDEAEEELLQRQEGTAIDGMTDGSTPAASGDTDLAESTSEEEEEVVEEEREQTQGGGRSREEGGERPTYTRASSPPVPAPSSRAEPPGFAAVRDAGDRPASNGPGGGEDARSRDESKQRRHQRSRSPAERRVRPRLEEEDDRRGGSHRRGGGDDDNDRRRDRWAGGGSRQYSSRNDGGRAGAGRDERGGSGRRGDERRDSSPSRSRYAEPSKRHHRSDSNR